VLGDDQVNKNLALDKLPRQELLYVLKRRIIVFEKDVLWHLGRQSLAF